MGTFGLPRFRIRQSEFFLHNGKMEPSDITKIRIPDNEVAFVLGVSQTLA